MRCGADKKEARRVGFQCKSWGTFYGKHMWGIFRGETHKIKIFECPERKSICCQVISKEKIGHFVCQNCGIEFIGGECEMKKELEQQSWEERFDEVFSSMSHLYSPNAKVESAKNVWRNFIADLLETQRQQFEDLIIEEILIAQKENTSISQLDRLFMAVKKL